MALNKISLCLLISLVSGFSIASEDGRNTFYGIYTTDEAKKGCTVLATEPVRNVAYYNDTKIMKEIAEFISFESGRIEYMALQKGMNAVVGYRESLQVSRNGGVATFTGVGVKLKCDSTKG